MKNKLDSLISYKNNIIDLSKRNRLLKYPQNGKKIIFKMDIQEFIKKFEDFEEINIEFTHKQIFEHEDSSSENLHTIYNTDPKGEKLLNLLNDLRLETKRKFEEHGLHTLFLTIGQVKWKELIVGSNHSGKMTNEYDYNAPLLLIPIIIEEKKHPRKFTSVSTYLENSDITINKVLNHLLEKEYKSRILDFDFDKDLNRKENMFDWQKIYQNICDSVNNIFSELKVKYEISDEIKIGQYSFSDQQIYEDLNINQEKISNHEFINSLCCNVPLHQQNLEINLDEPDQLLNDTNDFNVMDADSSQLQVIQNAMKGNHLNIQGPPGTGKSQTIVNLISNFVAQGKSVLLVCEKQVALEVVLQRLKERGLDSLCLPLFHYNSDKKNFAKSIIEDCEKIKRYATNQIQNGNSITNLSSTLEKRARKIEQLKDYAKTLNENIPTLNRNLYWVHGEFTKHQNLTPEKSIMWMGTDPLNIKIDEYHNVINILENMSEYYNIGHNKELKYFKNIERQYFSPDFAIKTNNCLEKIKNLLNDVKTFNLPIQSITDFNNLINLAKQIKNIEIISEYFIDEVTINQALQKFNESNESINKYDELNKSLSFKYNIPFDFNIENFNIDSINEEALIEEIKISNSDLEIIKNCINKIQNLYKEINQQISININELISYKKFYYLNYFIDNNKNQSIGSLKHLFEQFQEIEKIYQHFNTSKIVCNKWSIFFNEIDISNAKNIYNNFENYGIFRIFNSQYFKDCNTIKSWCNNEKPQKHDQYLEIINGINNYFKFKNLLKVSIEHLHQEYCIANMIDEAQILNLTNNIKEIIDCLNQNKQDKIPENILQFINQNKTSKIIKEFYDSINAIESILEKNNYIFKIKNVIQFISTFTRINQEIEKIIKIHDSVTHIKKENKTNLTVKSLQKDVTEINELSKQLNKIVEIKFIKNDKTIIQKLLTNSETIQSKEIKTTIELIDEYNRSLTLKEFIEIINKIKLISAKIEDWKNSYSKTINELNNIFESNNNIYELENIPLNEFIKNIDIVLNDKSILEKLMEYRRYHNKLKQLGYEWFIKETKDIIVEKPSSLFAKSLWSTWLEAYYSKNKTLQNFNLNEHNKIIEDFKKLENDILDINVTRILMMHSKKLINHSRFEEQEQILIHQSELKTKHKPIRKLVYQIGTHLLESKPCWMMSPLTLSSYIPYDSLNFDVVIFDEASQMRVEHALGAIARSKQIIIFGDENQLPPTSFFDFTNQDDDQDDETSQDYESILHATKEILPDAKFLLSYHYRSKYEDLIAFSNHWIYEDKLITTPNPIKKNKAVQYEFVENGFFDGGNGSTRQNEIEAEKVIQLCIQQITEEPDKSLGVIAFSKSQENCIRTKLAKELKANPELSKLDENSDCIAPFFIKNLESVQGDERDVIILSVGYGRDKKTGEIYNRFGPINSKNGYRRLNVAVTRAKEKIICVSSIKSTDIKNTQKSRGALLLSKYLEYAQKGVESLNTDLLLNKHNIAADSPLEEEIEKSLQLRGYKVHRQVGTSRYKIDLAIVDPKNNNQYILGIECDGASYHCAYSARMNDRIKQDILQKQGWKIYRIWSQHWIWHKEEILNEISKIIDNKSH